MQLWSSFRLAGLIRHCCLQLLLSQDFSLVSLFHALLASSINFKLFVPLLLSACTVPLNTVFSMPFPLITCPSLFIIACRSIRFSFILFRASPFHFSLPIHFVSSFFRMSTSQKSSFCLALFFPKFTFYIRKLNTPQIAFH